VVSLRETIAKLEKESEDLMRKHTSGPIELCDACKRMAIIDACLETLKAELLFSEIQTNIKRSKG